MAVVYLGVGSNLDPDRHVPAGLDALASLVAVEQVSPWYRSPAVGFDGPDFINLVVRCETAMPLEQLIKCLKDLEYEFGRSPDATKYSSRALDVDILLYDDLVGQFHGQTLPRSDIWRFAFVLRPLLDLTPVLECPLRQIPVADYLATVADQPLEQVPGTGMAEDCLPLVAAAR